MAMAKAELLEAQRVVENAKREVSHTRERVEQDLRMTEQRASITTDFPPIDRGEAYRARSLELEKRLHRLEEQIGILQSQVSEYAHLRSDMV